MNKEVKELIDNYVIGSTVYADGEIKDKEAMVKALNELAEYNNKKFHFNTALIKLNRIKDGDTTYNFDKMEAKEILDYINQLETNIDEAIKEIKKRSTPEVAQLYIEILERGKE